MRSLSESNMKLDDPRRSHDMPQIMSKDKLEGRESSELKAKNHQYRSKSKVVKPAAATIPRHQMIYNKARQKANQDLIDLGCMKTIEDLKNEKAQIKKKTPITQKQEVKSKKEMQSQIYLGEKSKDYMQSLRKTQDKIKEQVNQKFQNFKPPVPIKRQITLVRKEMDSSKSTVCNSVMKQQDSISPRQKAFGGKKLTIDQYIMNKTCDQASLDQMQIKNEESKADNLAQSETRMDTSGQLQEEDIKIEKENFNPTRKRTETQMQGEMKSIFDKHKELKPLFKKDDIDRVGKLLENEINNESIRVSSVNSPKSKTQGKEVFQQVNRGSSQSRGRRIDSGLKDNSKTPKRRINSLATKDENVSPCTLKKQPLGLRERNHSTMGLSIMCQTISVEPYIRRAVQRAGWIENVINGLPCFHVKFDVSDINQEIKKNQYYNHFPDNREIVTKGGLTKNLWSQCPYESQYQISHFFPRSYDLSDTKQAEHFVQDYQQTAILSIINKYALLLMKNEVIMDLVNQYKQRKKYNKPDVFIQNFKKKCNQLDALNDYNFWKIETLDLASQFARHLLHSRTIKENEKNIKYKRSIYSTNVAISQESVNKLLEAHQKMISNQFEDIDVNSPCYLDRVNCVLLHFKLQKHLPQYRDIDGNQNVWVVKPTYSSRGRGIYCTNQLKDILQVDKKSKSKVVQKYIENPYLINQKKFDLRQWVLVTCWDPLDVYVFDTAYLKLCSTQFSLTDLEDVYKHLSSFSIQKTNQETHGSEELVKSAKEFEQIIGKQFTWKENMLPKIKDIVYRTFKACQDSFTTDYKSKCFEIYGFDLILDEKLNPWVIEINLSPACSERVPWLTKMLDDMAYDLIIWLERKILLNQTIEEARLMTDVLQKKRLNYWKNRDSYEYMESLNHPTFYQENDLQFKWERLQESIQEVRQFSQGQYFDDNNEQGPQMGVIGYKASNKYERKLDKSYWKYESAALITRAWRGYKGRMVARHLKQTKAAIIIQKYGRMFLAIQQRKLLKQIKCAIIIQSKIRQTLAKSEANHRRAVKIHLAKCKVAKRLQCHYRRKKAQALLKDLRMQDKARRIQKYLRGLLSWRQSKYTLDYKCKIIYVQKFYRRRFKMLRKKATIVQKFLKGRQQWIRAKNLMKINKASYMMNQFVERRRKTQGLDKLWKDTMTVRIQCKMRQIIAKEQLKQLQINFAQAQIQSLVQNYIIKIEALSSFKSLKSKLDQKALIIQAQLRQYRLGQKLICLKQRCVQEDKAEYIQRFVLGYIIHKKYQNLLKEKKATAATKIQSWVRMIKLRKSFLEIYAQILEQKREEQLKFQSRTSAQAIKQTNEEIYELLQNTKINNPELKGPKKFVSKSKEKMAKSSRDKKLQEMPKIPAHPKNQTKRFVEKQMTEKEKQIKQLEEAFYQKKELTKKENSKSTLSLMHKNVGNKEEKQEKEKQKKLKKQMDGLSSENINLESLGQQDKRKKINKNPSSKKVDSKQDQSSDTKSTATFAENLKNLLSKQREDSQLELQEDHAKKQKFIKGQAPNIQSNRVGPIKATAMIACNEPPEIRDIETPSPGIRFLKKQTSQLSINSTKNKDNKMIQQVEQISSRNLSNQHSSKHQMFPEIIDRKNSKHDISQIENRPIRDPKTEALVNISMKKSIEQQKILRDAENYAIMASSGATISSFASKISSHIDDYNKQGMHPNRKVKPKSKQMKKPLKDDSPSQNYKFSKYEYNNSGMEYSNEAMVQNAILDGMMIRKSKQLNGKSVSQHKQYSESIDREMVNHVRKFENNQPQKMRQKIATTTGWKIVDDVTHFEPILTSQQKKQTKLSPTRKPPKQERTKKQQYGNNVHLVLI